jgi:hypothetical protein
VVQKHTEHLKWYYTNHAIAYNPFWSNEFKNVTWESEIHFKPSVSNICWRNAFYNLLFTELDPALGVLFGRNSKTKPLQIGSLNRAEECQQQMASIHWTCDGCSLREINFEWEGNIRVKHLKTCLEEVNWNSLLRRKFNSEFMLRLL